MSGSATDWSTGYRVAGGPGPTVADLEELTFACGVLERAADRLDAASWSLLVAMQACDPLRPAGRAARDALADARDGHDASWRVADHLRDLAAALRRVVELYVDAESLAERLLRVQVVGVASALGEMPLVAGLLGVAAVGVGAAAIGGVVAGSLTRSVLMRRKDPFLPLIVHRAAALPNALTADRRAELAILAVGSFVRSAAPGRQIPTLRAVPEGAAVLAGALPPAGPTALLVRADPPQLPAPRTTADVLDAVARSYDRDPTPFHPGTPEGVISVQQLTHPDGTRAWVIAIPGTEDWGVNADNPLDATTDARLIADLADDMTEAVLEAMRVSGIGAEEHVMLAGHSLGGMVAMSVATVVGSAYTVKAIATAGAPDISGPSPAGVQVRHYRHAEDLVPRLDGTPDRVGRRTTVVTRDLSETGGPAAPSVLEAHDVHRYVQTAAAADRELAGSPGMRTYDRAVEDVLGPPGTTAVTHQFQATRDPAIVVSVPPTVRPSS